MHKKAHPEIIPLFIILYLITFILFLKLKSSFLGNQVFKLQNIKIFSCKRKETALILHFLPGKCFIVHEHIIE